MNDENKTIFYSVLYLFYSTDFKDYSMNIFERNYKAVEKRGCINSDTKKIDFSNKLGEEVREFYEEYNINSYILNDREAEELTDIMNTCANWLKWSGRDPHKELEKVAIKNENRYD